MTHVSLKFFVCLFIIYTFVGKHFDCCNIISFHPKIFGSLLGDGKVFFSYQYFCEATQDFGKHHFCVEFVLTFRS